jgi:hypothetical protein
MVAVSPRLASRSAFASLPRHGSLTFPPLTTTTPFRGIPCGLFIFLYHHPCKIRMDHNIALRRAQWRAQRGWRLHGSKVVSWLLGFCAYSNTPYALRISNQGRLFTVYSVVVLASLEMLIRHLSSSDVASDLSGGP